MARGRPSKKQLILDTARRLFSETGYQGTSIDLVVKEAEVSKPTIYNNFPTKQALLVAFIEELLSEGKEFREKLWQQEDLSPADGIIKLFEQIATTPDCLAVYRISYGESYKLEPETYKRFKQFDRSLVEDYKQWLMERKILLTEADFLSVIAICREGILIPALSGSTPPERALIESTIAALLKQ